LAVTFWIERETRSMERSTPALKVSRENLRFEVDFCGEVFH
jgi:hypothetical protein